MNSSSGIIPGVIAGLLLAPFLSAQTVSVAGEWELITKTKQGEMVWKVVFEQEGESLTVTMTGPRGADVKGTGTLKEDLIEWTVKVPTPRGPMTLVYSGIVQSDRMSGEVQRGNLGKSDWSAGRKAS